MALYSDLQVYKSTYDLYLLLFKDLPNVPRDIKFTVLQDLKNKVLKVLVLIYKANSNADKIMYLDDAASIMVEIKIYIRLLSDTHSISIRKYAQLIDKAGEISKQVSAWRKYVIDKQKPVTGSES